MRGENRLRSLKRLLYFPLLVGMFPFFFLSLIQESVSSSIIDEVHYGLKSFRDLAGQPYSCNLPAVIQLLESAKRLLIVPVKKKEPVTPEVIQRLVAHYGSATASLADNRLLILCLGLCRIFSL